MDITSIPLYSSSGELSAWGAGMKRNGKWGVYYLVDTEKYWLDYDTPKAKEAIKMSAALNDRVNEAIEFAPQATESNGRVAGLSKSTARCGHPYPARKGRPPLLCPNCEAAAAS